MGCDRTAVFPWGPPCSQPCSKRSGNSREGHNLSGCHRLPFASSVASKPSEGDRYAPPSERVWRSTRRGPGTRDWGLARMPAARADWTLSMLKHQTSSRGRNRKLFRISVFRVCPQSFVKVLNAAPPPKGRRAPAFSLALGLYRWRTRTLSSQPKPDFASKQRVAPLIHWALSMILMKLH